MHQSTLATVKTDSRRTFHAALVVLLSLFHCACHAPSNIRRSTSTPKKIPAGVEVLIYTASDGVTSTAWLRRGKGTPSPEQPANLSRVGSAILFCHGMGDNVDSFIPDFLADAGYTVMTFNYRTDGPPRSVQRTNIAMRRDTLAALRLLRAQPGVEPDRVIAFGMSMGAGYALAAGADAYQHGEPLRAVVASCGFSSWRRAAAGLYPVVGLFLAYTDGKDPIDDVVRLGTTPLMLTHARDDEIVDFTNALRLEHAARRASVNLTTLFTDEGGHIMSMIFDQDFQGRIVRYCDEHLAPR